jgi:hypothetical protein
VKGPDRHGLELIVQSTLLVLMALLPFVDSLDVHEVEPFASFLFVRVDFDLDDRFLLLGETRTADVFLLDFTAINLVVIGDFRTPILHEGIEINVNTTSHETLVMKHRQNPEIEQHIFSLVVHHLLIVNST